MYELDIAEEHLTIRTEASRLWQGFASVLSAALRTYLSRFWGTHLI